MEHKKRSLQTRGGEKRMTITIPEWILWALGIPLVGIILTFVALGIYFCYLLIKES